MKKVKAINITQPVMDRIIKYEKARVNRFRFRYTVFIAILAGLFVTFSAIIIRQMFWENTFDILALFTEDGEIISEFWRDTVITFWEELPQLYIISGLVVLLMIVIAIILTRHVRRINRKKLTEIKDYRP